MIILCVILLWGGGEILYRLKNLTSCDIFTSVSEIPYKFMKKLLNRLFSNRKKTVRHSRNISRNISAVQIAKMGKFGQTLVVMSR